MNQLTNNEQNWELRYRNDDTPWTHNQAHGMIISLAEKYLAEGENILEIGCGVGEEAIELSRLGFNVLGIDLAPTAIAKAKAKTHEKNNQVNFEVMDFITEHHKLNQFDAILDVACFHTFKTEIEQRKFTGIVANHLKNDGLWINLSCISPAVKQIEKKTGVGAPPAVTLLQLAQAAEQHYLLVEIQNTFIPVSRKNHPVVNFPAWVSVFKKIAE